MRQFFLIVTVGFVLAGCSRTEALEIPKGTDVTVEKRDGVKVTGRLVEVEPTQVVLQAADGAKVQVARADIESVKTTPRAPEAMPSTPEADAPKGSEAATPAPADGPAASDGARADAVEKAADRRPEYREFTIPSGTVLPVELTTSVGSDTSHVEDQVRGKLRRAITIDGKQAIPAGTAVLGHVTSAVRPAKVKGRGTIAFRFNQIDLPGEGNRHDISTGTITRLAPATKKQDAAKIGGGAAGGAIIGGILGGGSGAAKGAAIGGGAGTAVVLSTRGKDIRLAAGTPLSVKLTAPLTVRVRVK